MIDAKSPPVRYSRVVDYVSRSARMSSAHEICGGGDVRVPFFNWCTERVGILKYGVSDDIYKAEGARVAERAPLDY